jgi:hypothetical protein
LAGGALPYPSPRVIARPGAARGAGLTTPSCPAFGHSSSAASARSTHSSVHGAVRKLASSRSSPSRGWSTRSCATSPPRASMRAGRPARASATPPQPHLAGPGATLPHQLHRLQLELGAVPMNLPRPLDPRHPDPLPALGQSVYFIGATSSRSGFHSRPLS